MNLIRSLAKPQYLFRPGRCAARIVKHWRRDSAQRVTVRLPWGVSIAVDARERVGGSIWRAGVHDLPVAEALWRMLDPGDVAIDAGANLGYTAGLMARRVGRTGTVLCFEPEPGVFQELQDNIERIRQSSDAGEITAYQIALSDHQGEATFVCTEEFAVNRGSGRLDEAAALPQGVRRFTVATKRLDDVIGQKDIGMLKIDVEGHELGVLRGAASALKNRKIAHIVYEDFGGGDSPVHQYLAGHGYSVYALGWVTHKPVLTDIVRGPVIDATLESPNYLATLAPADATQRFRRWGWSVI